MIKVVTTRKYFDEKGMEFTFEPIEDTLSIKKTKEGYEARYLVQDDWERPIDEDDDDHLFIVNYHRDFWVVRDSVIREDDVRRLYQGEKIEQQEKYFIFPMACFIHGGVSLSLSSSFACDSRGWDTSHVGLVLISKEKFKTEEKARKAAESFIEEKNKILSGEVYGIVKDKYDKKKKLVGKDSVWGFIGFDYAKGELKAL